MHHVRVDDGFGPIAGRRQAREDRLAALPGEARGEHGLVVRSDQLEVADRDGVARGALHTEAAAQFGVHPPPADEDAVRRVDLQVQPRRTARTEAKLTFDIPRGHTPGRAS